MYRPLTGLTSLRGIAALLILVFHTHGILGLKLPDELLFVKNYFGLGVPIFFVISAFSLYLSTTRRIGTENWIKAFYVRRFMRVAPLFYFMCLVYIIYIPLRFGVFIDWKDVLLNITFMYNLFPGKHESIVWAGWTLGVEMLFYIVLPVIMLKIKSIRGTLLLLMISLIVSNYLFGYISDNINVPGYSYMSFAGSFAIFIYGILTYRIYEYSKGKSERYKNVFSVVCYFLLAALIYVCVVFYKPFSEIFYNRSYYWGVVFMLLILTQCLRPIALLDNVVFRRCGDLSFSIYLVHPLVIYNLAPIYNYVYSVESFYSGFSFLICCVITFGFVYPLSIILNRFIESNGVYMSESYLRNKLCAV
ncbi:acyltransferase family protein [Vibrio kanaloae]|uniref:acyltransferase family protein n=1 Tax=Vibrio kanaloae TaxID=170673 RepID=UPI001EFE8993|nr:acyltransferase [Vibrio kanaloae]MCG9555982.1 acyltransferase [Vibrio kanaloae]